MVEEQTDVALLVQRVGLLLLIPGAVVAGIVEVVRETLTVGPFWPVAVFGIGLALLGVSAQFDAELLIEGADEVGDATANQMSLPIEARVMGKLYIVVGIVVAVLSGVL
jgi:hypothetical protein